jgi:hypothetical protein
MPGDRRGDRQEHQADALRMRQRPERPRALAHGSNHARAPHAGGCGRERDIRQRGNPAVGDDASGMTIPAVVDVSVHF